MSGYEIDKQRPLNFREFKSSITISLDINHLFSFLTNYLNFLDFGFGK